MILEFFFLIQKSQFPFFIISGIVTFLFFIYRLILFRANPFQV
ncbi:hypothetical protein P872_02535 [Rhodonellum psychrophilum GCM71 = DSM 17998]|uniref:Uncharacterized protein n=1 Tax=Rhodonellum psychrophilum GCM71 = DSM 17998 TaxID=1123057 RepID=U5BSY1_9BACT|nr:hypothetical protein P872_02535 [Rhodonellum psychrophilum GCM71 = DSM 17998]